MLLVAVASWADDDVDVYLDIDWKALGMKPAPLMRIPAIAGYQDEQTVSVKKPLTIPKGKGFLIVIE